MLVGVDPLHQRTGAGSALVRWGIAQADEARVALHADSTPGKSPPATARPPPSSVQAADWSNQMSLEGLPLYEHLGFTRVGDPKRDDHGAVVSLD